MKTFALVLFLASLCAACGDLNPMQPALTAPVINPISSTAPNTPHGSTVSILD